MLRDTQRVISLTVLLPNVRASEIKRNFPKCGVTYVEFFLTRPQWQQPIGGRVSQSAPQAEFLMTPKVSGTVTLQLRVAAGLGWLRWWEEGRTRVACGGRRAEIAWTLSHKPRHRQHCQIGCIQVFSSSFVCFSFFRGKKIIILFSTSVAEQIELWI